METEVEHMFYELVEQHKPGEENLQKAEQEIPAATDENGTNDDEAMGATIDSFFSLFTCCFPLVISSESASPSSSLESECTYVYNTVTHNN